jgi:hypothetical protein
MDDLATESDYEETKNQYALLEEELKNVISFVGKLMFALHAHTI